MHLTPTQSFRVISEHAGISQSNKNACRQHRHQILTLGLMEDFANEPKILRKCTPMFHTKLHGKEFTWIQMKRVENVTHIHNSYTDHLFYRNGLRKCERMSQTKILDTAKRISAFRCHLSPPTLNKRNVSILQTLLCRRHLSLQLSNPKAQLELFKPNTKLLPQAMFS